ARRRQVRTRQPAQPRPAPGDRSGGHRRAAEDRPRQRQPAAGAGAGGGVGPGRSAVEERALHFAGLAARPGGRVATVLTRELGPAAMDLVELVFEETQSLTVKRELLDVLLHDRPPSLRF